MMKKTKIIRGGIMALFVLAALLLVYLVVRQTMPDIIPLLRSGDEEALEAYLSRDMSFTGILYMALLQMVQVWSIVISGVIVNVAAGVVYGVWRAFAICLVSSSLAHGISFTLYQRLGKYLDKLLPDNSSDKLDIVAKSEHPAYMVVTLCFLPLIPNGFIPIAASRSRLKPWEFTLAMFFGSAFSTLVLLAGQQSDPRRLDRFCCAGRADAEHCVFAVEVPEAGAASGRTAFGKEEAKKWKQKR